MSEVSLPKCFELLNADYFGNLQAALNAAGSAAELQSLIDRVYADISMLQSTLMSQIELLGPIAALMELPTDLNSVLEWAKGLIENFIGPYFTAYTKMLAQVAALAQVVANIEATIDAVKDIRFPNVEFNIPGIQIGCSL